MGTSTFYAKDHIGDLVDIRATLCCFLQGATSPESRAMVEREIVTVDAIMALLQGHTDIERLHYRLGGMLDEMMKRGNSFDLSNAELFKLLIMGE